MFELNGVALCVNRVTRRPLTYYTKAVNIHPKKRYVSLIFECCVFQNGLIVACYMGWVDVVIALSQCPHIDVNWQDNEGNTALMTAAQAGKNLQMFQCWEVGWFLLPSTVYFGNVS